MIFDNMDNCFASLSTKVNNAIKNTDLNAFYKTLDSLEGPTLVSGVGGSSVVATFLAKVLREKRHIIATFVTPRDMEYMDLSGYKNVISVSYSGTNIGSKVCFKNNLNKYLITGHPQENVNNILYKMDPEESYVSISATIVPLAIILLYYKNDISLVNDILKCDIETTSNASRYEVMSGYETLTAHTMLESSIIESGMAACIVHDKYNYCHGRINLSYKEKSDLIFFKMDNELDDLLYDNLQNNFNNMIIIDRKYEDNIINDFYATLVSLKLIYKIALNKNMSISDINYFENNDVFYLYKGAMK